MGFPTSHQPRFYATPNSSNGDKLPKFVVFWTISTIKDEKSAAKFHSIKMSAAKLYCNQLPFKWYQYIGQGQLCSLDI